MMRNDAFRYRIWPINGWDRDRELVAKGLKIKHENLIV